MADGWITIGTELATDKFDKQIVNLEKKIENEEKKKINIEAQMSTQVQELEEERKKASELGDVYQRINELQDLKNQKKATYGQMTELIGLQQEYGTLEKIGASLDKSVSKQDSMQAKVDRLSQQYDGINDKVAEYGRQIEQVNLQKHNFEIGKMKGNFDDVGKNIQKAIGKVGKLALGIFGLRSAFIAVRQASSQLASYDKQYAANLEYIRFALTQMIAPVLRWIVSMAMKLLQIIGVIVKTLFGVNIFANAGVDAFKKMKANAGKTAKSAKDIKKELAGFDEMNVLTDNKNSGGGGGVGTPSLDLSDLEGLDLENTTKWIEAIKQALWELLPYILGIATALGLIKLGLDPIKAIGIGVIVFGIIKLIQDLLAYLNDPSWANFGKMIQDIGIILVGFGITIGSIPLIVAGAIVMIVGLVVSNWETIRGVLDGAINWLDNAINNVTNFFTSKLDFVQYHFGIVGAAIWMTIATLINTILGVVQGLIKTIKDLLDGLFKSVKQIVDGIIKICRGDLAGGLKEIGKGIVNVFITFLNFVINALNTFFAPFRAIIVEAGNLMGKGWNMSDISIPNIPMLAKGGLINMPGKGTLVGSAIAGERGVEGVIPLTDTQMMEQLGETIGRYITINANIVNKMNGRTISRELKVIQNNQDFAYNL